jgi:KDO2-lipid IV(A) lauroyltransferase
MRVKWGNKIVPLGISIRQVYKELKEKRIVAMVADQRGPSDGIRINFMGRKASVFAGPALLALKTSAPIMFGVTIRQPDFSYKLVIEVISTSDLPEEEKIAELSQRHASVLEKYIRQFPEQWFWMHKRWKY